jgi:translocating chain-associated membrane protein 1
MGTTIRKRPGTNKAMSYLSHEFIIKNHGDIATCLCMVFIVGLMFQVTAPLASVFIAPKHNVTELDMSAKALYSYGYKDICLVLFYTLAAVIFHAVIQEYVLDKLMKKVRLSKTKANKFNESGQLVAFYALSVAWAINIFKEEGYFQSVNFFWTGYPHVSLTFLTKFFFIIQMSYWIHVFPELYFQKVKKEDIPSKITFAIANFVICAAIYVLNLTRIGLVLIFIDNATNLLFHVSRLLHFAGKNTVSTISFNIYNVFFVIARLAASILSIFVFWFGLKSSNVNSINFEEGNFNTGLVRIVVLSSILVFQAWMMWNFILFQFKKLRENSKGPSVSPIKPLAKMQTRKSKETKSEDESGEGTDVDKSSLKKSN